MLLFLQITTWASAVLAIVCGVVSVTYNVRNTPDYYKDCNGDAVLWMRKCNQVDRITEPLWGLCVFFGFVFSVMFVLVPL